MTIPANYDASTLNIDPGGMNSCANTVLSLVQDISNYLSTINSTLSNLTLSWVGTSSSDATTYNDEWNAAVQKLFGTQDDPSSGALVVLVNGIMSASANYSQTEDNITDMFNSFASGFSSGSSSSTSNVTDQTSDPIDNGAEYAYHSTAATETY
jgi:uncharacterized protein YukE